MADLKPCPFCGGEAELIENNRYTDIHSVMCKNCYSESDRYNTKENAVKAWNTRKLEERTVKELEELASGVKYCWMCGGGMDVDEVLEIIGSDLGKE